MCERERERERGSVCVRERVCVCVCVCVSVPSHAVCFGMLSRGGMVSMVTEHHQGGCAAHSSALACVSIRSLSVFVLDCRFRAR